MSVAGCASRDSERDEPASGSTEATFDLVPANLTLCTDAPYEPFEFPDPSAASVLLGL